MGETSEGGRPTLTFDLVDWMQKDRDERTTMLTRIETKLDSKADKADLMELKKDLEHHSERISRLETSDRDRQVATTARNEHVDSEESRRVRRREVMYSAIMMLLTVGLVLGTLGVHL